MSSFPEHRQPEHLESDRRESDYREFMAVPGLGAAMVELERPPRTLHHGLVAGALAAIALAAIAIGIPVTRIYAYDLFFFLDSAWRVAGGLKPHVDFSSAWGPLTAMLSAAGLWLSDYRSDGLGYSQAFVAVGIGIWAYALAARRLGGALAAILSFMLAALAAAPFPLGQPPFNGSYAMVYNRHGYALLGLILIECFPPPRTEHDGRAFWGGVSSGAATALLAFLKVSFAMVAGGFLVLSLVLWRHTDRRRLAGLACGAAVASAPLLAYLRFDVGAVWSDLRMAAASRSRMLSPNTLRWNFLANLDPGFLGLGLLALLAGPVAAASSAVPGAAASIESGPLELLRRYRLIWATAAVYGAGVLLLSTNAQAAGLPLNAVFALLIAAAVVQAPRASSRPYAGALVLFAAVLALPQLASDLLGFASAARKRLSPRPPEAARFEPARLASLVFLEPEAASKARANGSELVAYINDGAALLARHSPAGERVTTFDAYNPFPYLLDRPPPRGGMAAAVFNMTYSDAAQLPADAFFGDADVILVPKRPASDDPYFQGLEKTYGAALQSLFEPQAESERWILYRRR